MILSVQIPRLAFHLQHEGPFIYYFNRQSEGLNKKLVENMKKIEKKYPKINILELDWQNNKRRRYKYSEEELDTVVLYYNGEKKQYVHNPDLQQLETIIITYGYLDFDKKCKRIQHLNSKLFTIDKNGTVPVYNKNLSQRDIWRHRDEIFKIFTEIDEKYNGEETLNYGSISDLQTKWEKFVKIHGLNPNLLLNNYMPRSTIKYKKPPKNNFNIIEYSKKQCNIKPLFESDNQNKQTSKKKIMSKNKCKINESDGNQYSHKLNLIVERSLFRKRKLKKIKIDQKNDEISSCSPIDLSIPESEKIYRKTYDGPFKDHSYFSANITNYS